MRMGLTNMGALLVPASLTCLKRTNMTISIARRIVSMNYINDLNTVKCFNK